MAAYFTINTGQDIQYVCEKERVEELVSNLKEIPDVRHVSSNTPSHGGKLVNGHLF